MLVGYSIYDVIMMSCSPDDDEITADDFFTGQGSAIAVHRLIAGICIMCIHVFNVCMIFLNIEKISKLFRLNYLYINVLH